MSDEIYDQLVYDGEKHVCLLTYPSIRDRLILLNGWSKTYAMTGWRLGYAVWPGKLYDYARKLAVNLHSCVNAPTQFAGLAALQGPQDAVSKMVAEFDKRRKVVVDGLNKLPGVSCIMPKGAFYAFPNVKRTGWKAKPLAASLLDDTGVALIGGPDFGILGEGYMRVSYANSTENILKALDRMGEFLASARRRDAHDAWHLHPRCTGANTRRGRRGRAAASRNARRLAHRGGLARTSRCAPRHSTPQTPFSLHCRRRKARSSSKSKVRRSPRGRARRISASVSRSTATIRSG